MKQETGEGETSPVFFVKIFREPPMQKQKNAVEYTSKKL